MIRYAKIVCAGCGRHWAWETIEESIQFEMFEIANAVMRLSDEDITIERSCPECKAAAMKEEGVGPFFAKSLRDEREGRSFKAWTGRRTA